MHAVQDRIDEIRGTAGFAAVLEMLRESGKPAVGHNPGFDIAFTLEHLAQPLPPDWPGFKALAREWFPGPAVFTPCLYAPCSLKCFGDRQLTHRPPRGCAGGIWDTKHLFQQLPEAFPRVMSTSLGPLHEALLEGGLAAEVGHGCMTHAALCELSWLNRSSI